MTFGTFKAENLVMNCSNVGHQAAQRGILALTLIAAVNGQFVVEFSNVAHDQFFARIYTVALVTPKNIVKKVQFKSEWYLIS